MVMYDNNTIMSWKQKKIKFEARIKLNHNIYTPDKSKPHLNYSKQCCDILGAVKYSTLIIFTLKKFLYQPTYLW